MQELLNLSVKENDLILDRLSKIEDITIETATVVDKLSIFVSDREIEKNLNIM
jgi:hypothetical protein